MINFKNKRLECVIDIGTNKIVCVIFEIHKNNSFNILSWSQKKSNGIYKSQINNVDDTSKTIKKVISEAGGVKIIKNKPLCNITDIQVQTKKRYNEISIGGINVSKKEIRKLYKKNIQNCNLYKKRLIHSVPINFNLNENQIISDPIGIDCEKLGIHTFNIWINSSIYKNLESCFKKSELNLEEVADSGYASSVACLHDFKKDDNCVCIDIGAGSTKVAAYYKGGLEFLNYTALGGNDVTNDIENGLEISSELAEYIKVLHGGLEFLSNKKINVDLTDGNQKVITQNLLQGIIKPRYEEIFEIIRDKLDKNITIRKSVNKIILTGGASQIPGLKKLSKKIFNRETVISSPKSSFKQINNKPEFSTIFGLIKIRSNLNINKIIQLNSDNRVYNLMEKFDNWLYESFM